MHKKGNSNLLNPESAVEDFLDTLLQESTEKPDKEKPVRLKSKIILLPDLELESSITETTTELQPDIPHIDNTLIDVDKPQENISFPVLNAYQYNFPLQCLMFNVSGNQLSIPLINMGSVLNWSERLTMLPGSPDWFLGILKHRDINVKVADTAKIINIRQNQDSTNQYILIFGDDNWAITCDQLGDVIKLNEDDVKWSKQGSNALSLGTIKQSLAILLNPEKILIQLNKHEEERID